MITNYIKMAWRVLGRKKFFTAISLFGISFTLGLLMVILAFFQNELGTDRPLTNKNDIITVHSFEMRKNYVDTIPEIDTSLVGGEEVYDTTYRYENVGQSTSNSNVSDNLFRDYFSNMNSVDVRTIYSVTQGVNIYHNGSKFALNILNTDPEYWEVIDHQLLEGRFMNQEDFDGARHVAVISDRTAIDFFGRSSGVVGEEMQIEDKSYEVIGVIPYAGKLFPQYSPHIVLPYSTMNLGAQQHYFGYFNAMFLKNEGASLKSVKEELDQRASSVKLDHPDNKTGYEQSLVLRASHDEYFSQGIYYDEDEEKSASVVRWILLALLSFFVLLPTINLINLNVSRILERSSEIGVRKAFGADRSNIITQFIIENIVITLIGGFIGLVIAYFLIGLINNGGYLGDSVLYMTPKFFLWSLLVTLVFGVLSGLIPALRMSRLQIVNALKQNKI